MVFSSTVFLFLFLPIVLALYFLVGKQLRNYVLLVASLFFYAWGEHVLVLLMVGSILINYTAGMLLFRAGESAKSKSVLCFAIALNLGLLVYFKYFFFLIENLATFGLLDPDHFDRVSLPIGISFFTFQGISYLVDVYRKDAPAERNPFYVGLYISLFPQLIAGPIIRFHDVAKQIRYRFASLDGFVEGAIKFIRGLAKKVLIANSVAMLADQVFDVAPVDLPCIVAWVGVICYALQIYFDFSGYSDMAIGLGKMFGFDFKENFAHPYVAKSMQDFWRRWHISLSTWFRDYLYIPIGGNRLGSLKTVRNLMFVFFVTGLWHGASWNFVVWGLFHGVFLLIERFFRKSNWSLPALFTHFYVILVVLFSWVLFRAPTLNHAMGFCKAMFGGSSGLDFTPFLYLDNHLIAIIVVGILFSGPLRRISGSALTRLVPDRMLGSLTIGTYVAYLALLLLSITDIAQSSYNPFIYFRF